MTAEWTLKDKMEILRERDALRARVAELEEHRQGTERLIDRLIETCPEARPIIHEFARETLNR